MLTADADWVAVGGSHWKGRGEIEREHAARHATQFKDSVWSTRRVHVAVLKPAVALVTSTGPFGTIGITLERLDNHGRAFSRTRGRACGRSDEVTPIKTDSYSTLSAGWV
jgi:uncharacterized protein (TIGR02246 family)